MTAVPWKPDQNLARLHARADAAGFQLIKMANGVFRVLRWGMARDLKDEAEVDAFLRMVGAPS